MTTILCAECDTPIIRRADCVAFIGQDDPNPYQHRIKAMCRPCAELFELANVWTRGASIWPNGLGYDIQATRRSHWQIDILAMREGQWKWRAVRFTGDKATHVGTSESSCGDAARTAAPIV